MSARTGVAVSTLRAWEERYGFPVPKRLPSGHRRYHASECDALLRVLEDRKRGIPLSVAIERARVTTEAAPASLFGELRSRQPTLVPQVLSTRALLAVSRAIEDEQLSGGRASVVVGAFELPRHYRRVERRWRDLATTSRLTLAFADFRDHREPTPGLHEVPLATGTPMRREWAVACDGTTFAGCMVAWERTPKGTPPDRRRFEALWTVDRDLVRAVIGVALSQAVPYVDGIDELAPWSSPAGSSSTMPREAVRATNVLNRIVARLDRN